MATYGFNVRWRVRGASVMPKISLLITPRLVAAFPEVGWKRIPRKRKKLIKQELTLLLEKAVREYLDNN